MITVCGPSATLAELKEIPLVEPSRPHSRWKGVQHGELVQRLIDQIGGRGWQIKDQMFSLTGDGAGIAGAFDIDIPSLEAPEGQRYSLGILGDNNMKRSLRIVVGTRVFVCNNGMATGEIAMCRKHTTKLNISDAVHHALDEYYVKAHNVLGMVKNMQKTWLCDSASNGILMDAGRKGILPWSHVGRVDDEYEHPIFTDVAEHTCWGLYNAFTHIVKQSSPLAQMSRMNRFRELLPVN